LTCQATSFSTFGNFSNPPQKIYNFLLRPTFYSFQNYFHRKVNHFSASVTQWYMSDYFLGISNGRRFTEYFFSLLSFSLSPLLREQTDYFLLIFLSMDYIFCIFVKGRIINVFLASIDGHKYYYRLVVHVPPNMGHDSDKTRDFKLGTN
jgi:hypothetical protein